MWYSDVKVHLQPVPEHMVAALLGVPSQSGLGYDNKSNGISLLDCD